MAEVYKKKARWLSYCATVLVIVLLVTGGRIAWAAGPSLEQDHSFSDYTLADIEMYFYIPDNIKKSTETRPLVVILHGCGQKAPFFAENSGWMQLAEQSGFAILAPQQSIAMGSYPGALFDPALLKMGLPQGNMFRCFSWFDYAHSQRIAESVVNMMARMSEKYPLDRKRVYIAGLSGGAGMTAAMLAFYPQWFEAGATIAGVPFNCAESSGWQGIKACMQPSTRDPARLSKDEGGKGYPPEIWGGWVRAETCPLGSSNAQCPTSGVWNGSPKPWPRVSIWQASQDRLVAPGNMQDLMKQWTNVHGIDQVPDGPHETCDASPYTIEHDSYADANGRVLVETWLIEGVGIGNGHGAPINPDDPEFACGLAQPFMNDANICSTRHIAEFFGLVPTASDHEHCRLQLRGPALTNVTREENPHAHIQ